jgi:hypothetical protein
MFGSFALPANPAVLAIAVARARSAAKRIARYADAIVCRSR